MINTKDQINLANVNYRINDKLFFKNLSINFSIKGITVILGPNGSGKSLLTKIIKGLIKPECGNITLKLNGKDPRIGYLSQRMTFLRRNVFNNLAYPMEIKGYDSKYIIQIVSSLLEYFEFLGLEFFVLELILYYSRTSISNWRRRLKNGDITFPKSGC